jgi:hypothetical protein
MKNHLKAFFRGLLATLVASLLIATLVGSIYGLIYVWHLNGYTAVLAFLGFSAALVGDVLLLCRVGKEGAYAKGSVRS